MNFEKAIIVFLFFTFLASCSDKKPDANNSSSETSTPVIKDTVKNTITNTEDLVSIKEVPNYPFKYQLEQAAFKAKMPSFLIEISALGFNPVNNTLVAVNDELGNIYSIDAKDGSLLKKTNFGYPGDYEGIEIVNFNAFVIRSDGRITAVDTKTGKAGTPYKLPFTLPNDVEGLGFDKDQNALIIACKGQGSLKNKSKLKKTKAFYAFDLDSLKLIEKPKFTITDDQLEKFFGKHSFGSLSKKANKKLKNRLTSFSPSAIAKHPESGHFYILSSIGKLLIICDNFGKILDVKFLDSKQFSQPEGICFSPDANMFISNEGGGFLPANIQKFEYQK